MGLRVGLVFLIVLLCNWACDSRHLTISDLSGSVDTVKKIDVCELCEEYASMAVDYLTENETQAEIIEVLHNACSELYTLEEQCITLVDDYTARLFSQISTVEPDALCETVNLCHGERIPQLQKDESSCDACHRAVDEILVKLQDPHTKLEIIEILLKGCDAMENYAKKCKAVVFEYGPLVLARMEKYLEKTDICTLIRACNSPAKEAILDGKIMMVSSS